VLAGIPSTALMRGMDIPDLDAWRPWPPQEVHQRFSGIDAPWCFVGGWAIDLWLGEQTRPHEDIEVSVLREDLKLFLAVLPDCDFFAAGGGKVAALNDLTPPDDIHQVWCLERATQTWKLDIMLEPGSAETWRYKRDARFQFPRKDMVLHDANSLPILRPEAVLLFKAKAARPKDEVDFQRCLPRLKNLAWLADALRLFHPQHPWLSRLGSGFGSAINRQGEH
jgi:hypothetical protein